MVASCADGCASTPRISIAIYMHDLSSGGIERMNLELARAFQEKGADVSLVLHSGQGDLQDLVPEGVKTVALGTRRTAMDLVPLARYLRTERPNILLSGHNHNNIVAALAKTVGRSRAEVVIV